MGLSSLALLVFAQPARPALPAPPAVSPQAELTDWPPPYDSSAVARAARLIEFRARLAAYRQVMAAHRSARTFTRRNSPIQPGQDAATCLTQAIYYEARGESVQGQSAVAQVVLNRTRNPRYPASVCAVVFQGAQRPGCQFSFACEGAAQTGPIDSRAWSKASTIASRMLQDDARAGDVGGATHYHTAAVAPAWDRQLREITRIGRHIFFAAEGRSEPSRQ